MKVKTYFIILIILFILFFYSLFCYTLVNKAIFNGTNTFIKDYFDKTCNHCTYKYKMVRSTLNKDGSINVFIKVESDKLQKYYRFIVVKNGYYELVEINQDIPSYIKKEWLF